MIDLSGSHVLITGAGGGIGRALVECFREAGAAVSGFDLEEAALADLGLAHGEAFDIRDADSAAGAVQRLMETMGVPDVLINNAGWTRGETLPGVDGDAWRNEIELNLNGAFYVTQPILGGMLERGSGTILFVDSVNALLHFGNPAYSAAKAGMLAFCRSIAVEYGAKGIRANAICPGSVRTGAWDHRLAADPGIMDAVTRFYPLGRIVEPHEVAAAALFLCSPLASGITGVALPVDAGLTAGSLPFVRDIIERRN
jgi:NAD(P)-dependent dehydrogenase (short-subunit alcohol dehydrogenase family)